MTDNIEDSPKPAAPVVEDSNSSGSTTVGDSDDLEWGNLDNIQEA